VLGLEVAPELVVFDLDAEVGQQPPNEAGVLDLSIVPGAQKSGSYSSRKCSVRASTSGRPSRPIAARPARWPALTRAGE
jgi:hypothetical protein